MPLQTVNNSMYFDQHNSLEARPSYNLPARSATYLLGSFVICQSTCKIDPERYILMLGTYIHILY